MLKFAAALIVVIGVGLGIYLGMNGKKGEAVSYTPVSEKPVSTDTAAPTPTASSRLSASNKTSADKKEDRTPLQQTSKTEEYSAASNSNATDNLSGGTSPQMKGESIHSELATSTNHRSQAANTASKSSDVSTRASSPSNPASNRAEDAGEPIKAIGKGLTIEKIQAMDVSEEEKRRLIDDMVFYHGNHPKSDPHVSDEEIYRMIIEDEQKEKESTL